MTRTIEKIWTRVKKRRERKAFFAWQIELTTRCPLACKMCIRRENDIWQNQDMPFGEFRKLLPYLKDVETVILEGWGESLLYENLTECIRLIKREGPRVGFVTSGKGLDRSRASELVAAGLDFVGLSIAGTSPETHAAIRVNSHLSEIFDAARLLNEKRTHGQISRPKLHLVFLMLKDNISEVPAVPTLAKEMGIEEVFLTNICHAINTWQEKQRIFLWGEGENQYENVVKKAEAMARKLNIRLKRPSLVAREVPVCEENPLKNLYVSAEGEVSPCVYLHPPLPSPFKRIFCGKEYWVEKLSCGNAFQASFPTIWSGGPYVDFRGRFIQRDRKSRDLYLSLLEETKVGNIQGIGFPEPPDSCKSCHKILGL